VARLRFLNKALLFIFLISGSCATDNAKFITDSKNFWYHSPDKGLFYCRANVAKDESADPSCLEAGFQLFNSSPDSE
jgi:hypothetical protein